MNNAKMYKANKVRQNSIIQTVQ